MNEVYFMNQVNKIHQAVETNLPSLAEVFGRLETALSTPTAERGRLLQHFPGHANYSVKYLNLINNNHQLVVVLVLHNWNDHQPSDKVIEIYTLATGHNELQFGDRTPSDILLDMFITSKITI